MLQWFYLGGCLLVIIGFIKLLVAITDKSEKEAEKNRKEREAQEILSKSDSLNKIADNLSKQWKS